MNINTLIRQQCTDACSIINLNIQFPPTFILITSKDKIVHMQLRYIESFIRINLQLLLFFISNEQNRPSNSDIFLLLLNNTSRSIRNQFQLQENNSSSTMAHIYKTKAENNIDPSMINSMSDMRVDVGIPQARRVKIIFHFFLFNLFSF